MASEKRVRLNPEARRAQLIELGVEMLATRTLDELSVEDIAQQAGISRGLLFHYFASKRDFQVAVVQAAAGELIAAVQPDQSLDVVTQLSQGLDAYIGYIEQNPVSYTAIVRGAGSDDALLAVFEETRDVIVQLVAAGIVAKPSPLLRLAVRGWIASVEETTILWLRDKPCSRDDLIELLFNGALQLLPLVERISGEESAFSTQ